MNTQKFVYVSYIKTSAENLWKALTTTEFTRQYWMGQSIESDWKAGSPINIMNAEGVPTLVGKILVSERPKVLSYTWIFQHVGDLRAEKPSRVTFLLEKYDPRPEVVKLTVTHDDFQENSKSFESITNGWPMVLSSLKSLLETDHALLLKSSC